MSMKINSLTLAASALLARIGEYARGATYHFRMHDAKTWSLGR